MPDYLKSEQGERPGQRATEEGRGQPSEGQRSEHIADPHSRQDRACGMYGQTQRYRGRACARRPASAVRRAVTESASIEPLSSAGIRSRHGNSNKLAFGLTLSITPIRTCAIKPE